jgi:hypothetical protein
MVIAPEMLNLGRSTKRGTTDSVTAESEVQAVN